jgi:hypothetical protein
MAYLYRHIRLDKNEPFYIGISIDNDNYKYIRAYSKNRNNWWKNIVAKTEYEVEIILDDLTWEEAKLKETEFIVLYGRKDLGTGTLVNMTYGGEGKLKYLTEEERLEAKKEYSRKYKKLNQDKIKNYYKNNKDKIKEYRENNKDKIKEYNKKHQELNKEKRKEYDKKYKKLNENKIKEYRENNKDKIKEYRESNKDKIKEYNKKYQELNKEKRKQYQKEYDKKYKKLNENKIKEYQKNYYEKKKLKNLIPDYMLNRIKIIT